MNKKIACIILTGFYLTVFMNSCAKNNSKDGSAVFSVCSNVIPKDLKYYSRVRGVDIPMFKKILDDTTIVYTLNFDETKVSSKAWHIHFDSIEDARTYLIMNDTYYRGNCTELGLEDRLCSVVHHSKFNQLYQCTYNSSIKKLHISLLCSK